MTIPVIGAIARIAWSKDAAIIATIAYALSPFAISFAPTAFTDPLLVLAGNMALLLTLRARPFWAGIWLGIAIMTKQQGLFYVPLVVASHWSLVAGGWSLVGRWGIWRFVFGLGVVILPIVYWDSLRWSVAPSPWDLGVKNYSILTLADPSQWYARASRWLDLFWYLTASKVVWILLTICILLRIETQIRQLYKNNITNLWSRHTATYLSLWTSLKTALSSIIQSLFKNSTRDMGADSGRHRSLLTYHNLSVFPSIRASISLARACLKIGSHRLHRKIRAHPFTTLILLWSTAFITLHLITTLQTWDRYLLPLAPILALIIAKFIPSSLHPVILSSLLFFPAYEAAQGHLPIGSDHGAYSGLEEVNQWLIEEGNTATKGAVLYHHMLGWHHRFYLYDAIAAQQYELRWYPHEIYLVDNMIKTPHRRKFLLQPNWHPLRRLALQTAIQGLDTQVRLKTENFILYEIIQPPQPSCEWCFCTVQRNIHSPFSNILHTVDRAGEPEFCSYEWRHNHIGIIWDSKDQMR